MTKGSLENILLNFRKQLSKGLSEPEKILSTINGHQASPHDHRDHFTLFNLPLHEIEIDRVHWQTIISPILYHRLIDNGYSPAEDFGAIEIVDTFGTIYIRSTGQVEGYSDFSKPHRVAQLEGVMAFLKQICNHQGNLKFKIHENEFTVKINVDSELAQTFMKKFNKPKVAFLEHTFKTYYDDKKTLRNESSSVSDMIIGLEQQYSEPLSKGGINAFVFGPNEDNTLLIQQLHEKIDFHTEAITELQNATKELMIHSQDMKRENELSHEQQRDQGNRVMNLLYEKQTSFFVKKCDLIVQKLTERDLTLDELAITFKQKKQGLLRYLNQLEEKGVIKSVKVFSGERGRPKNKYHLIGENSEKK